jgi:protein-disulfide isomerase
MVKMKSTATQPDLTGELEKTKAALAEAQTSLQSTAARLKDYEDDYQAVWFNFINEPQLNVPVDQTDSIRGKVDAPHTIVMFMDLQCPYCQGADKILEQKLAKYPNQLRLVVKHFPLDKTCNEHVTGQLHPAACPAAVAVEAARAIGGDAAYFQMYDELFAHQGEFAKSMIAFVKAACERNGISNDELWKKINTKSAWDRVKQQTAQVGQLGVDGTPTIFYDGRKVAGWANSKFWDFVMWREAQGVGASPAPQPAPQATQPAAPATQPR